ncbi:MAG: hypothetical protein METHSR3v1_820010 [Methanothrix sp.]|nr:MAG: hypothetical protein METHSR3v1_820010 [Methanothrix sp.]
MVPGNGALKEANVEEVDTNEGQRCDERHAGFGAGIGERERGSQAPQGKQDQRDAGFRW